MNGAPAVVVAGLGRCGTTLVMTMLDAGGVPCAGEPPGYEDRHAGSGPISPDWLADQPGTAVKVIDPHRHTVPDEEIIVVWLDRDPMQQARSQAKFYAIVQQAAMPSRAVLRRWRRRLLTERKAARRALSRGEIISWHDFTFEHLLANPERCARILALDLAGHGIPVASWTRMAAVVDKRGPACAPGLEKEFALLNAARVMAGEPPAESTG